MQTSKKTDDSGKPSEKGYKSARLDGFVLVDKPKGITSFDVIRHLRRLLKIRKMGHMGTLDPNATGLLPICIGRATRLSRFLLSANKRYRATIRLGRCTTTYDAQGDTVGETIEPPELTDAEIERLLDRYRGTFKQRPPIYSAKKIDGKRLYQYAREGHDLEPDEYDVTILKLEVLTRERDKVELDITSSSGMYVRSLANDLGKAIGSGAYLEELTRLEVGGLSLEYSYTLEKMETMVAAGDLSFIQPMADLLPDYPAFEVNPGQMERIRNGNPVVVTAPTAKANQSVRLLGPDGDLLAVGILKKPLGSAQAQVHPKVVLLSLD
jgi:tRNA pseudouridine55 synthase